MQNESKVGSMGPYGPIKTHMGPARNLEESVGPARALEESVGSARDLEEREKFRKNAPLFV